jgi:hypothetical protein
MNEKHYIDDLTDFDGTLNELKLIVDYLHDNYGSCIGVKMEIENDSSNVFLLVNGVH